MARNTFLPNSSEFEDGIGPEGSQQRAGDHLGFASYIDLNYVLLLVLEYFSSHRPARTLSAGTSTTVMIDRTEAND